MTFVEALKLKRPARRKGLPRHCGSHGTGWIDLSCYIFCRSEILKEEDLLTDDWEVSREAVEIEKADLREFKDQLELEVKTKPGERIESITEGTQNEKPSQEKIETAN